MSKYHNKRVRTSDGCIHDSKKEAIRWNQLKLMEKAGLITDLKRQEKFLLIPTQREESTELYKRGERKGKPKKAGKVIEKEVVYIADFVYFDNVTEKRVVEDVKGLRTPVYILKRKLMLFVHGIRIKEI